MTYQGKRHKTKVSMLTKAAVNGGTSFVVLLTIRPPRCTMIPLRTAFHTCPRFDPGLLLLQSIVIVREKLGTLNEQGHVSGDVAYASRLVSR